MHNECMNEFWFLQMDYKTFQISLRRTKRQVRVCKKKQKKNQTPVLVVLACKNLSSK